MYQIAIPFHCSASLHSMGMPSFIQLFITSWTLLLDYSSCFSVINKAHRTFTYMFLCGRHDLSSLLLGLYLEVELSANYVSLLKNLKPLSRAGGVSYISASGVWNTQLQFLHMGAVWLWALS